MFVVAKGNHGEYSVKVYRAFGGRHGGLSSVTKDRAEKYNPPEIIYNYAHYEII
jgi:hypothetical protein